ncbi:flap endonuclease GEN [Sabethes cyaneus]|uniref:flap endonuclease GEN n=1 Tax=Sabethes cyaneus TaxID=53552 RepID=UPI00237D50A3|nr:flap endonuclease GEN [Sabethes cyaneus]
MGIKDLWNLLTPYCEKKPLFELNEKAVAIDLSGWVCESLNVVDYFVHPRFYLRNLFFRTCYLLQTGIIPVFILEGTAPPLKYGVIIKRNQMQFRGARPKKTQNQEVAKSKNATTEQKRNRFHHVLKQCEELLSSLGLSCVQAPGEAEALCAYLNHDNLVYGVVSQDSDCFAYGATRVFRNFCASQNGGSVEVYDLIRIRESIDLGQEKIVAMGILSGCDYCPTGVPGVGRETVNRFLRCYKNQDILGQIRSWRQTADRLTESEMRVQNKDVCADCGHYGKLLAHRRVGCQECKTREGCDLSRWQQQRLNVKAEMDIKRKAVQNPNFPPEAIINEFMTRPCEMPILDLHWKQPNLVKFVRQVCNLLQWDEIYGFQKILPLLTRWQIVTLSTNHAHSSCIALEPDYIKKKRSPKGVTSYEIIWKSQNSCFSGLIPDDQIQTFLSEPGNTLESLWSTIEPENLVATAFPALVESFLASKVKKTKTKKLGDGNRKKRQAMKPQDANQKRLDEFLGAIVDQPAKTSNSDCEADDENDLESIKNLSSLVTTIHETAGNGILNDTKQRAIFNMSVDSVDLDKIALDSPEDRDFMNVSEIVDRVCDSNYGNNLLTLGEDVADLASIIYQMDSGNNDAVEEHMTVQHRLLLKQDVINHVVTNDSADQSLLNSSLRPRKRMSFFFEPLDVPPPELQDNYNEMDMFECSLMLKDQIVLPVSDELNQTVIYDIDF